MAPPAVVSNGAAGITTVKSAPVTGRISTVYSEVQITRSLFLLLIALLLAIQMKLPSCSHACLDSLPGDGKGLGSGQNLKIGVVLSGGQAPGGHNVISGIYDYLQDRFKGSTLYGFKGGPAGIMKCKYVTLTSEYIYPYRNQSMKPLKQLKLSVPAQETPITSFLTASGTFQDGDLMLNQKGLRLISEENDSIIESDHTYIVL